MLLLIFLILLSLNEPSSGHEAVPKDIRDRVREAQTFSDLLSITKLAYAPHLVDKEHSLMARKGLQLAHIRNQADDMEEVKLRGASLVSLPSKSNSDFRVVADAETRNNLELLSTIRQGNDTCMLQSICVPVPIENPDPGLLVFPRCYEVTQCVGSCCDSIERCHPTSVEYLQRPVVEMLYSGNNIFMINQTVNITFEQHLACSCRECTESGPALKCSRDKIVGPNCNCECKNKQQKRDCQGWNKVWDDEKCSCVCTTSHCHGRTILDPETCLCRHQVHQQSYADPDSFGNYRSDTSRLHRLSLSRARTST